MTISSADCERGYSCMNLNDTDIRNSLAIDTLSSMIFIKNNGPKPADFDPSFGLRNWMVES